MQIGLSIISRCVIAILELYSSVSIAMKLQMGRVAQFHLPGNVLLRCRLQNGNQPAFVLKEGSDRQTGTGSPFKAYVAVSLGATAREKLIACLELPEAEHKLAGGRKMVCAPTLIISGVATDRIAEQKAFICISVVVLVIEVDESRAEVVGSQHLRGCSFPAKIQFLDSGNM